MPDSLKHTRTFFYNERKGINGNNYKKKLSQDTIITPTMRFYPGNRKKDEKY